MRFPNRSTSSHQVTMVRGVIVGALLLLVPRHVEAQKESRPPAATQGFDEVECRSGCVIDTLTIDVDRGRRAQPGTVVATMVLIDTIAIARRGAPPPPRERNVPVWVTCDSSPCAAAIPSGRVNDRRLDDARVVRRTVVAWQLPAPLLQRLLQSHAVSVAAEGRLHPLTDATVSAVQAVIEPVRTSIASAPQSPRAQLYVATFATFGIPGDSSMAEDVGTATEPLMIPDASTPMPTRVSNLALVGRGEEMLPLLVQDDATGAAPIFGIGETVTVALPAARGGRRGIVTGKVLARQRVETLRDTCHATKLWTYLLSLTPADLAAVQRGAVPSPRPTELLDRWSGTAVREPFPARLSPTEQRAITASRSTIAQFVRQRAATGVRTQDVQVLAALPKAAGYVTNLGLILKDGAGGWRFPSFALRGTACRSK